MLRLWPLVALTLAGCGSAVSVDKACSDSATARCNKEASCSNGAAITKNDGDMSTCLLRQKANCTRALAAKSTGNTPDNSEKCAPAITAESCGDFFGGNTPAACLFSGAIADGAACAFNGQCRSGYCTNNRLAACGVCGQPPALGGDCTMSFCAHGQTCLNTPGAMGAAATCTTEGTQGAACSRTAPCAAGFSCIRANMAAMGTCMSDATTVGAACDLAAGPGCARTLGLWCNTTTKMCTSIDFAANGAPCGQTAGGDLVDCKQGACYGGGAGVLMGLCKADAADGAACDTRSGPGCTPPARCAPSAAGATTGTCVVPDGSTC